MQFLKVSIIQNILIISVQMIGPQYQRLAELEHRYTTKQLLQRAQSRLDNPLHQILQKLKKEYSEYETMYSQDLVNQKIGSVDRLLSFDGKLGPILASLEKQNNLLRRQLSVMQNQLSNTVSICEQVMTENTEQKQIIEKKNEDIQKIISTIALNHSEGLSDLTDQIQLLQQENSILIRHLEEIKSEHIRYTHQFRHKDEEINGWKRKWEETKKQLSEALSRQHDLSRKLSLSEQTVYQQSEDNYKLEQKLHTLNFEVNELKNEVELRGSPIVRDSINKTQVEYEQILNEQKQLKKQRTEVLRQCEKLRIDNEKLHDGINQLQKNYNKALNDLEMTSSILNEQKHKNSSLSATISKLQAKIDQLKAQNSQFQMEKDSANSYAITKEKLLQKEIDELKHQIQTTNRDAERRLIDIKDKTKSLLEAKQIQMHSLNQTNFQLRKIIEAKQRNRN